MKNDLLRQMYNGMPAHPQPVYSGAPGTQGHYNPNMTGMPAPNEYMSGVPGGMPSMSSMPPHYHMQSGPHQHSQQAVPPQHPQAHPQGPPQIPDQSMAYQQPQP